MPEFVFPRGTHTLFRAAAIPMGAYVWQAGRRQNDVILQWIGGVTVVVDSITFLMSVQIL